MKIYPIYSKETLEYYIEKEKVNNNIIKYTLITSNANVWTEFSKGVKLITIIDNYDLNCEVIFHYNKPKTKIKNYLWNMTD